jgi:hypothetical protein
MCREGREYDFASYRAEGTASFADGIWLIFPPGAADQREAAKSELHREEF